jgi:hypothetical protein
MISDGCTDTDRKSSGQVIMHQSESSPSLASCRPLVVYRPTQAGAGHRG